MIARLFFLVCLMFIISCNKGDHNDHSQDDPSVPIVPKAQEITVKFSGPSVQVRSTKGYFDEKAETWEDELNSATCYVVKEGATHIAAIHQFTEKEVAEMSATFVISNFTPDTYYYFYVVANAHFEPNNIKDIETLTMSDIDKYNGDFGVITAGANREGGFVMSGISKAKGNMDDNTIILDIDIERIVSKYAIKMSVSSDFTSRFLGELRFNRVEFKQSSHEMLLFENDTAQSEDNSFSPSQFSNYVNKEGQNIFYLFENGAREGDEQVKIIIYATYDEDTDFETIHDQKEVVYHLNISKNNGMLKRNTYYQHTIIIHGLNVDDFDFDFSILDWSLISSPGGLG